MRNPTGTEKIQAQSIPEIGDFLDSEYKRLARLKNRVEFRGRSVSAGTLLNAIVLHFASFSPQEREAISREFLRRYEAILEHDDLQTIETDGDASSGTQTQGRSIKGLGGTVLPRMKRKDKASEPDRRPGDVFGLR